ncbi:MAG: hypothetical protein GEV09_01305 [Pseudonocardiaceae bacterium]|nr:hypothetical protein [Pseudonocardiaceae bacterium]
MSAISTSVIGVLDTLVDQLQRLRECALADAPGARRSARIAELYEQEARAWLLLFERSRSRLHWRAALSAQAHARACARSWRSRAATEAALGARDLPERAETPLRAVAGGVA